MKYINYVVYNNQGRILRTGVCMEDSLLIQADKDEYVIEGKASQHTQYVENSLIIDLPKCPGSFYYVDWDTKTWKIDLFSLNESIRSTRTSLLASSDWTQLPDVPIETKDSWAIYRQALRDITDQPEYPLNVIWPDPPSNS